MTSSSVPLKFSSIPFHRYSLFLFKFAQSEVSIFIVKLRTFSQFNAPLVLYVSSNRHPAMKASGIPETLKSSTHKMGGMHLTMY
jgi:hypothetical protein